MIEKLRVRIIFAAILAFAVAIIFVSALVNVVNYITVTRQADETLTAIMDFEMQRFDDKINPIMEPGMQPPLPQFMGMNNPEAEFITRFFVAKYDKSGNLSFVMTDNIAATKEDTEEVARIAINKNYTKGYIREYRYLREDDGAGSTIIFLNVMQDMQHLKAFRIITIIVALLSLLIVSVLAIIFSKTAIRPIVKNIERQKQFITDASHELKTPLTSIMTSLDVVTLEYGEDEWTDNIRSQTKRMSKLVGELVTLSRLDEENSLINKEDFSLSDVAWEILEVYQSRAKASGRNIQALIADGVVLNGDKNAIQQMLSVLLDNAIKYSKGEGDIVFEVSGNRTKKRVQISNPASFDKNVDLERLFDRFYRPDSSRNVNDGGSGIGLAIAKAVVTEHGGKISASCPDGTRMLIQVNL